MADPQQAQFRVALLLNRIDVAEPINDHARPETVRIRSELK